MKTIAASNIKWEEVSSRLIKYRELTYMDRQQFADFCKITLNQLTSFESGKYRKTLGCILQICHYCKISPKWLLMGLGHPSQQDGNNNNSQ